MSLRFDLKKSVKSNIKHILQDFEDECKTALQQEDGHQAIHETRKNLKKLRAFARLFRSELGKKKYRKSNVFYRDIARKISEERDVSAMLTTVDKLLTEAQEESLKKYLTDLKNHLSSRKAAISRIQINQEKLLEMLLEEFNSVDQIHASWKIKHNDLSAMKEGIAITYDKCQKAMKKAYKKPKPDNFHEWRKRAKYLRYEIDFLRHAWKGPLKSLEKELHQLTDYLGDEHDLVVLQEYIQQLNLDNEDAKNLLFDWIDEKRDSYRKSAKPLGKKILCESPDQFINRLECYWKQKQKELA